MALLPVYRWLGLEDEFTRREQWTINVLGLAVAVLGAHSLGYIDLSAVSLGVLAEQPGLTFPVVLAIGVAAAAAVVVTVSDKDLMDTRWVVAASVGGFFLIDLLYLHPAHFENTPALMYWLAKPIWVGIPMFAAVWWLVRNTALSRRLAYTIAGIAGIVSLQLYYSVIPISMVHGDSVQVGLVGNLTVGVPVHGSALLLALAAVVVAIQGRRYVRGWG